MKTLCLFLLGMLGLLFLPEPSKPDAKPAVPKQTLREKLLRLLLQRSAA